MRYGRWALTLALMITVGCGSDPVDPDPDQKTEAELEFLRFPPDLLPLVQQEASFWAVKGEHRELVMRYEPESPDQEGDEFLDFDVPGNALLRRPDGTAFVDGDSVLITVQVATDGRFLFQLEPSGLQFDPDHPAELEITYIRTGGDYNGDGTTDEKDDDLEARLSIWKQERPGDPFFKIGTVKFEDFDEIEAKVFSFTGFAVAA